MKNNPTVQREDENRGVKRKILILILILLLILLFSAITAATGGFHSFARALGLNAGGYTDGTQKNIGGTDSTGTKLGEPSGITISDGLVFDEPDSKDKPEEDGDSLNIGNISSKATGQLATSKSVEGFDMTVIVRPDVPRSGDAPILSGDGDQQKSDTIPKPSVSSNPENNSDKNQNSSSSSDTSTSSSANPESSNPDSSSHPENSSAPDSSSSQDSSSKPSKDEDSDSSSSNTVHVREVELDKTTLSLHANTSAQLGVTIRPGNAKNKKVTWSSSAPEIASVDANGLISALVPGEAVVTVKSADRGITAECRVTVTIPVSGIKLSKTSLPLERGQTERITATVEPENATNLTVLWSTQDSSVAAVDENGSITAVGKGSTVITGITEDGQFSAQCTVNVGVSLRKVVLSETALTLNKGGIGTLTAKVEPEDTTDPYAFRWSTSDSKIAEVDAQGNIKAIAGGKAVITVTARDSVSASCEITVNVPASGITLSKDALLLVKGSKERIEATITPESASNQKVLWRSSDEAVAVVDENGNITAINGGDAEITAQALDGGFTAGCAVTVHVPVGGISLNSDEMTLIKGKSEQLTAKIMPENASIQEVLWVSSKPEVASIDENGLVTAKQGGDTVITATTKENAQTAQCLIHVRVPVAGVTLNKNELTIIKTKSDQLTATVTPLDATTPEVVWSSCDESVATVTETGQVIACKAGSTTITATTKDGDFTSSCTVTVIVPVTGFTLNKTETTILKGEWDRLVPILLPEDVMDTAVSWESSDKAIATVDEKGNIKAISGGNTTITATTHDGDFTAKCLVHVRIPVTGIAFEKEAYRLARGKTLLPVIQFAPEDATDKELFWDSSDESVAKVNRNGEVTGLHEGQTTLTATSHDGRFTASCTVTVWHAVEGVTLNKTETTVIKTQSEQLTATIAPADATIKELLWVSSDEAVASVNENGLVTAHKAGSSVITVKTKDGEYTAACKITVRVPATGITLNKAETTIIKNQSEKLLATILPDDATDTALVWTSSDEAIAKVNAEGNVTAIAGGRATITATTHDGGFTARCVVNVRVPVTRVTLDKQALRLARGTGAELHATIAPGDATDKAITWASSNPIVATVNQNGEITALHEGVTTITVTTRDGSFTESCTVTVWHAVTGVTLDRSTLALNRGADGRLSATIAPLDATNKGVTWESSNHAVATVSGGTVHAVSAGTAVITVRTQEGGKTASCTVTVSVPVTGITLNQNNLALNRGASGTLTATVAPGDATNKNVSWSTSNAGVATVSNGTVYAVGAGSATITATTADGNKQAACTVTVSVPVTGITLNQNNLALNRGASGTLSATVAPGDATNRNVSWSTNNAGVATVSNGTVYAVGAGSATITATTADGNKQAACTVTVSVPVTGITLNQNSLALSRGASGTLTATVAPGDATNRNVSWSTSNAGVATVSNGTVYAVGAGSATITATTVDGNKQAACTVTVTVPVTGISLNTSTAEFKEGETTTLSATVAPWDASNKDVTWSTSDGTIATVSGGLVTGVKAGTATITAACGGYSATCAVTVRSKLAYKVTPPDPKNEWVSSSKVEDNSISWANHVKEEDSSSVMHYQRATIDFNTPLTNARVCFNMKGGTVGYSTVKLKAYGKDLNANSVSWSSSAYGWAYGSTNLDLNVGISKTASIEFYSGRNNNSHPAVTVSNIIVYSDEYPSGVALNDMTRHL